MKGFRSRTSSKKRTPAHGRPACTGSALTATSPTDLKRSSQPIILSASSFNVILRPANVKVHLVSSHACCFCVAASQHFSSISPTLLVVEGINGCKVARSWSDSRCSALFTISWQADAEAVGEGLEPGAASDAGILSCGVVEGIVDGVFEDCAVDGVMAVPEVDGDVDRPRERDVRGLKKRSRRRGFPPGPGNPLIPQALARVSSRSPASDSPVHAPNQPHYSDGRGIKLMATVFCQQTSRVNSPWPPRADIRLAAGYLHA